VITGLTGYLVGEAVLSPLDFAAASLRLLDGGRLYARRFLDFDLDLAIADPRSFAALWRIMNGAALTASDRDPRSLHALVLESDRHSAGALSLFSPAAIGRSRSGRE
jgi:hypothetical protein